MHPNNNINYKARERISFLKVQLKDIITRYQEYIQLTTLKTLHIPHEWLQHILIHLLLEKLVTLTNLCNIHLETYRLHALQKLLSLCCNLLHHTMCNVFKAFSYLSRLLYLTGRWSRPEKREMHVRYAGGYMTLQYCWLPVDSLKNYN